MPKLRVSVSSYVRFFLLSVGCLLLSQAAWATHLRAGEITARRVSMTSATYEITLTTYTDEINGKPANDTQNSVIFHFGGAIPAVEVPRISRVSLSRSTVVNTYTTTVTFPGPGNYTVSCGIQMRNKNTINLPGDSSTIPFFVQSTISVNASFGLNSTPVLLNAPIDSAAVGVRYIHNPGAYDVDGDSLSYQLQIVRTDQAGQSGVGVFIDGYKSPETIGSNPQNEAKNGVATFRINPQTGDLIWDAPQQEGQYNVAFAIIEWRRGIDGSFVKIGEIIRDMQIIVVQTDNKRPQLNVPPPICVEAGQIIDFEVTATDPDAKQQLRITSSGGVYNFDQTGRPINNVAEKSAAYSPMNIWQASPARVRFRWETNCQHVRQQEYQVLFKAEDAPERFQTQLTDIKTVTIKILPQRVRGIVAKERPTGGVQLSWQKYTGCKVTGKVKLYRRDGCNSLNPGACSSGIPEAWGYKLIGEANLTDSTFTDPTALKGQIYSYRAVAALDINAFTTIQSAASIEACIGSELPQRVPVITHVTVDKTDKGSGEITVRWRRPTDVDTASLKPPYRYRLLRASGLLNDNFQAIANIPTTLSAAKADTVFTDRSLNTTDNAYRYRIEFYVENDKLVGTSPAASSVRLTVTPEDKQLRLGWSATVPWNNDKQTHRVFRKLPNGQFNQIAEVKTEAGVSYTYVDTGKDNFVADGNATVTIKNDTTYCYRVEAVGAYEKLPEIGLLKNYSQEACGSPVDRSTPCAPRLTLPGIDCATAKPENYCNPEFLKNQLSWTMPTSLDAKPCRTDISSYRIYFSRYETDAPRQIAVVAGATTLKYDHRRDATDGIAGCYYVTAISSVGIESGPSNRICVDNCSTVSFPNVFTPNGDGANDTFSAMKCPAFVKSYTFQVFNRYGAKVYEYSGDNLNWDGTDTKGVELPSATYLYTIQVEFNQLSKTPVVSTFKGWVELIR